MNSPQEPNTSDLLARAARQIRPASEPKKTAQEKAAPPSRSSSVGLWLPPLMLGSILCAVVILFMSPRGLWQYVVGAMVVASLAWIAISSLWPGKPERKCPECGREALARKDARSHRGIRCSACGFEDESASSFMMAEEEGTLEETVLRERGRGGEVQGRV